LSKALAASPYDADIWQRERVARQRDTLQTLRALTDNSSTLGASVAQAEVETMMGSILRSSRPACVDYQR
jgi:hypothetical protein